MEIVKLTLIGFVLGITTIIPGISAATMAVAFNVYDRLINVIVPNVKKILGSWLFWLPMVIGGAAGIFFASKVFTVLFANYYIPTYWFFIGVITGSIPAIFLKTQKPVLIKTPDDQKSAQSGEELSANHPVKQKTLTSCRTVVCAVLALAAMAAMAMLKPEEGAAVYTELTLPLFGLLVMAGALGALAMIIPGISGAFVLLVTGFYRTVLQSVSDMNIPLLIPVIAGAIIGLLAGAAFVRFLLAKAPNETYGAVLGLVAGSVIVLYPGGIGEGAVIVISMLCLSAGFAISFFMGRKNHISF